MADGNLMGASKRPVGRPRKARGAANSSDAADARWTVRGVPLNVRTIATKAAERKGMTVGDWLAEAVVNYSRADRGGVSADAADLSADSGANLPAIPMPDELRAVLGGIEARLAKMEAQRQMSLLERVFGRRGAH